MPSELGFAGSHFQNAAFRWLRHNRLNEIKLDGFRMAARIDNARAQLLTRTGLDWTDKYPSVEPEREDRVSRRRTLRRRRRGNCRALPRRRRRPTACAGRGSSIMLSISCISPVGMSQRCRSSSARRCWSRWSRISPAFSSTVMRRGDGELILKHAGNLGFEGVVSKTIDAPYAPGNRGLWRKAKWLNCQEFVIVGWSDPEGSRPHLGALLLGYTIILTKSSTKSASNHPRPQAP